MSDLYEYVFSGPPKVKGSLSLFLNFSGAKACLVRLGSSRVVEVEWPGGNNATIENGHSSSVPSTPVVAAPPPPSSMAASLKRMSEDAKGKGKMRAASLSSRLAGVADAVAGRSGHEEWTGKVWEVWVPSVGEFEGKGFYVITKGRESGLWSVSFRPPRFLLSTFGFERRV